MATSPTPHRINLYDEIGMWGVNANDFAAMMRAAEGKDIELHIQSPGGSCSDGFAIANLLKAHVGRKVAVIDGFCASAATFAAMVCDEVHMHAQSMMLIHDPSGMAAGGADDLDTMAGLLRSISALMKDLYQKKTGASAETVGSWLSKDTWFTPGEALVARLVDKVIETPAKTGNAKASARTALILARYKNAPASVRALLTPSAAAPKAPVPVLTTGVKMKSNGLTRGLACAIAALANLGAMAAASSDPEEKAIGEQLKALDLVGPATALADVKDAPSLSDLLALDAKVEELTGCKVGKCGAVEALALNSSAKGAAASMSRMAQVDALLASAVNPQKGADGTTPPRKLTPAQAAGQRAQFVANLDKPVADLESFIKLAHPLPTLNLTEDLAAASGGEGATTETDPDFDAGMAAAAGAHKIGGAK